MDSKRDITSVSKKFADIMIMLEDLKKSQNTLHDGAVSTGQQLCATAIDSLQEAQLWTLRALTFKDNEPTVQSGE